MSAGFHYVLEYCEECEQSVWHSYTDYEGRVCHGPRHIPPCGCHSFIAMASQFAPVYVTLSGVTPAGVYRYCSDCSLPRIRPVG